MSAPVIGLQDMHLTEDQIDEALLGELNLQAAAHLELCADCAARLAVAQMPLTSFKAVTLAWSERQSATMPPVMPMRPSMGVRGRLMAWSAALSVMIAAGVAVPLLLHPGTPPAAVEQAQRSQAPVAVQAAAVETSAPSSPTGGSVAANEVRPVRDNASQDRISQDNAMLRDIDRELDASTATPAVLTLEAPHGPLAKPQSINE